MIERNSLYHIPYYNKAAFTGSYKGMRYKLEKVNADGSLPDMLRATVWPGPFCFDATSDKKKESESFEFSDDGITAACDWLNDKYRQNAEVFQAARL